MKLCALFVQIFTFLPSQSVIKLTVDIWSIWGEEEPEEKTFNVVDSFMSLSYTEVTHVLF